MMLWTREEDRLYLIHLHEFFIKHANIAIIPIPKIEADKNRRRMKREQERHQALKRPYPQ